VIVEAVQHGAGVGHLRIIGSLGYVLHETDELRWDPRHAGTRAELAFAVERTGVTHGELYDVVRQESYRSRRSA
jgi:hypothetical protein